MCQISYKLQFCTCTKADTSKAKHTWTYYRKTKPTGLRVIGDVLPPYFLDEETELSNLKTLKFLLNEKSVFDRPILFREGDMLLLSFLVPGKSDSIYYEFEYQNGKWEEAYYGPFEWMEDHKKAKSGKIQRAFRKSKPPAE